MVLTFAKSEHEPIMNAREFINCELDFDLDNSYVHIDKFICMLDERDDASDNEPSEEVDNVQIGDVLARVGVKDGQSAWVVLKPFS